MIIILSTVLWLLISVTQWVWRGWSWEVDWGYTKVHSVLCWLYCSNICSGESTNWHTHNQQSSFSPCRVSVIVMLSLWRSPIPYRERMMIVDDEYVSLCSHQNICCYSIASTGQSEPSYSLSQLLRIILPKLTVWQKSTVIKQYSELWSCTYFFWWLLIHSNRLVLLLIADTCVQQNKLSQNLRYNSHTHVLVFTNTAHAEIQWYCFVYL